MLRVVLIALCFKWLVAGPIDRIVNTTTDFC
ncbi:unnamed protein product [Allacma fusca]|uniref:Uncharacterized protein n=1 Tax=Allacma fusca TaxID=39272 RepID=A0A8J2ME27_9HEXA|nr:unnamed protein product [Allacma fusca]